MEGHKHRYIPGDYWLVCDECGFDYRRSEMKKRWDGCWVCKNDWEPKHPQLSVRANRDRIRVPVSRPSYETQLGSDLLGTAVLVGTGWTDSGSGVLTCDGSQTADSYVVWTSQLTSGTRYRIKASLTPYTDGVARLYSVVGDSLISDGDFSSDASWTTIDACWSIADGKATSDGNSGVILQPNVVSVGGTYFFEFEATVYNSGSCTPYDGSGTNRINWEESVSDTGYYYRVIKAISNSCAFYSFSFDGSIDNASVYNLSTESSELDTGDMSFKGKYGHEAEYSGDSGILVLKADKDFTGTVSINVYEVT